MKWRILYRGKSKEIIKILLKNRGLITQKQQREFLHPQDVDKLALKKVGISTLAVEKAVKRLKKAANTKEKVIVYGDYDTDGICATAIIWEALYQLGVKVLPFIPTRAEGYGLKIERIKQFAKEGVSLIITVDQGIVALAQAEKARKLGIDLIITDHHVPPKTKPKALAIVHTKMLSGAGVAWFLAKQLVKKDFLDLATIGTVSDMVPLLGPNRSMVKFGLERVKKTLRPGLLGLYSIARIDKEKIGVYEIGFIIGPRLNAAGRMDDPTDSLRLICTKDQPRAKKLAESLDQKNRARQELMKQMTVHARELWLKEDGKSRLIFVSHESYQEGIVGLVAGKLMEEFYRPAIIISRGEKFSRASARSIEEFNILEAIRTCADILGPHGGHPRAAGFTIETAKIELLKERLLQVAQEKLGEEKLMPTLKIDLELAWADLNLELYQKIAALEPFGEANPQPVFATRGVKIINARLVGNGNKHLKLQVTGPQSQVKFDAIGFNLGDFYSRLSSDKLIDIAYNLNLDEWNGSKKLQLKIKDIKVF